MTTTRKKIPLDVKMLVLHESGYKCANPVCRHVITLDIHHIIQVSNEGANTPDNLLPLCPNCHALHHRGEIPPTSIRAWKMLLMSLNEAFDTKTIDVLLALDKEGMIKRVTGDGVLSLSPLIASGLLRIETDYHEITGGGHFGASAYEKMYSVTLSDKGKTLVDSWKKGDQASAISMNNG